ncbi:MAG: type IV secretion protein DotH [Micavibrio sp.]|nr:type IV secretion protein DotH [Micavibrio sp.]|tara:strand:+ start:1141 stop:2190 length:1050 start_codon:yes stop_codon:yes gene_type:complete
MFLLKCAKDYVSGAVLGGCFCASLFAASVVGAQGLPPGPGSPSSSLPQPSGGAAFDFDGDALDLEDASSSVEDLARQQAFDSALQGLLPLRPEEIRQLLERFDRTQESVELPVYPAPAPEVVIENIDLDPGAPPSVIKAAYGHVTTVSFLDVSGQPWPIHSINWAGNFQIVKAEAPDNEGVAAFSHKLIVSPQSEFAYGNISVSLLGLYTPIILTLETSRDVVYYRFDAVMPEYGPLAKAPLIDVVGGGGSGAVAGSSGMSAALEGVVPSGALRMNVSGVDRRTSAFKYNGMTYVRTPLTLLSPGWNASVSSMEGMNVYEISNSPVLLLSDRGRMVRARLSNREDVADE